MIGLTALIAARQQAGKLNGEEVQSLLRLNSMPVEKIEACAKFSGLWHPKGDRTTPTAGDLVTFSVGNNSHALHAGLITAVHSDGTLRVRSESPLRTENMEGQNNAIDEEFTLKKAEVRGTISKPPNAILKSISSLGTLLTPLRALSLHKNLKSLMTDLLQPAPSQFPCTH